MQGEGRSRSGRSGGGSSRGKRGSRAPESNKANYFIIGVLVFAVVAYAGILGFVKMRATKGSVVKAPVAEDVKYADTPGVAAAPKDGQPVILPNGAAEQGPVTDVSTSVPMEIKKPVAELIVDLKKAFKEINAVDTPLNTASPAESIARLEAQIVDTPYLLDLKMELARRYLANEQYPEAAGQLTEILSAEPYNLGARKMLAQAFIEGEDYDNAIRVAHWILEEDKFSTEARNVLANCFMKTGDYARAIDQLRTLANENSLDVVTQNNLGVAHSRMKRFDLAVPIFEKTIRIDKANAVGYFNLAICHAQQNAAQKSCDVIYKAAEQFGPSFVAQWITSNQFSPIADTVPFERLKARFSPYIADASTATTMMTQKDEKPTAPFGKAALPKFDVTDQ